MSIADHEVEANSDVVNHGGAFGEIDDRGSGDDLILNLSIDDDFYQ